MNPQTKTDLVPADDRIRELLYVADRDDFELSDGLLDRIQTSLMESIDSHQTSDDMHQTFGGVYTRVKSSMASGRLRAWVTACVVAMCLVVSLMTFLRSPEVLGDVFSALRSQPRVHIRCQDIHGQDIEAWISDERFSVKRADSAFVFDRVSKAVDTYYPAKQRIVRSVPSFQHEPPAFDSLVELLRLLPGTNDRVGGMKLVSLKSEPDSADAAAVRHSIELASPPSHLNGTIKVALDVITESKTSLPSECTVRIRQSGQNDPLERTVKLVFDYPREVPQSVHELGASADAKLVDTTNPESDPLYAKVQTALERGRRGLKRYVALAGTDPRAPQYAIWRSDRRWRVDDLGGFQAGRISGDPGLIPSEVDLTHWKDHVSGGGHTLMLFDGVDMWDRNAEELVKRVPPPFAPKQLRDSEWIGTMTLERMAYPFLGEEDGFVMAMTEESPGGLVLVEYSSVVTTDELAHRTKRYWLNPEYGYAVVKWEYTDATGSEDAFRATMGSRKTMIHLNAEYQQSPDGIWYPGAVREVGKQFFQTPDNPVLIDDWMYYVVDFSADISEGLFETP
ncbi:MAG: hypothetical protein JNL58_22125 [Planctomyces sp.]|nr:hypothetical protein [Planctomyces sp.]